MKDTNGREWLFRFTARTVRELAAETKLDTKALTGPRSLLQRIGEDETTLYLCLWITIRPEAQAVGITEEEWFESLDDDALQRASHEWLEAYINFSHPARREVLLKTLAVTDRKITAAQAKMQTFLASGELDAMIEQEIDRLLNSAPSTTSAVNTPVSSEST
jgi:hypothetical protein